MKTQRVRIMVIVSKDGSYAGAGTGAKGEHSSERDLDWIYDSLPNHVTDGEFHKVWVEADVPLPEAPTVEGKVAP